MDRPIPVIPLPISDSKKAFMVSPPYVPLGILCSCIYYTPKLFHKFYETVIPF